jgi:hypothetical protein
LSPRAHSEGERDDEILVGGAYLTIRKAEMEWRSWLVVMRLRRGRNLGKNGVDVDVVCGFEEVGLRLSDEGKHFRSGAKRFKEQRTPIPQKSHSNCARFLSNAIIFASIVTLTLSVRQTYGGDGVDISIPLRRFLQP